ncbi:MAG: hypothetical protein GY940_44660 [bacterium]|nr:hypothetical protein [bacterium]
MNCEDSSGTEKDMLTLDPELMTLESNGAMISKIYDQNLDIGEVLVTPITDGSTGWFIIRDRFITAGGFGVTCLSSNTSVDLKHQPGSAPLTNTKDSYQKLNIYFEDGNLKIQNKFSYSKPVEFGFFGINAS